jgi:hypothetical protein
MDDIKNNLRQRILKIKNVYQKYKDTIENPEHFYCYLKGELLIGLIENEEGSDFVNEILEAIYNQYLKLYTIATKDDKGIEVLLDTNNENLTGLDYFKSKVKSFIDYGGDVNTGEYILNLLFEDNEKINYGEYDSPLKFAIKHNDMETAKLLLDNEAVINKEIRDHEYEDTYKYCYSSNTVIQVCAYGSNEFIKFIMNEYMKKNSFSKVSDIPGLESGLLILYRQQKFESIRSLFEYDFIYQTLNDSDLSIILGEIVDGDSEERYILEEKMIKIVEFSISYGIDINKEYDNYGLTILAIAIYGKFPRFTIFLIENGSTIDEEKYSPDDIKFYNVCYTKYMKSKAKERSDVLREELIVKYYAPENIEKWSVCYGRDFDEVQEIM